MKTRRRSCSAFGLYFAITIVLVLIFGSDGKNEEFQPQNEFKLEPWIEIQIGGIDLSINKAVLYLFLASALTIGTMVWISPGGCRRSRTGCRWRSSSPTT